jgi:uncharacterized protein (TIGR00106 family)
MVMAEFTCTPVGAGESLSGFVAEILKVIDDSGLEYRLTPMGTIVEGLPAEVLGLAQACLLRGFELADRVSLQIKIDAKRSGGSRLASKIESVQAKAGRPLRTLG